MYMYKAMAIAINVDRHIHELNPNPLHRFTVSIHLPFFLISLFIGGSSVAPLDPSCHWRRLRASSARPCSLPCHSAWPTGQQQTQIASAQE